MWVWIDGRECNAIMVVDQNKNGIIDNGKELFNPEGTHFDDAFEILQDYGYDDVYFLFDVPYLDVPLGVKMYGTTDNGELKSLDERGLSILDFAKVEQSVDELQT